MSQMTNKQMINEQIAKRFDSLALVRGGDDVRFDIVFGNLACH